MLLEVEAPPTLNSWVAPPLSPTVTGTITVTTEGDLFGSGTGWSTSGKTLTLKPTPAQQRPVWYQFTVEMAEAVDSLFGLQIFTVNDPRSTAFIPAGSRAAVLNLVHDIPSGGSPVLYTLAVGYVDPAGQRRWIGDPTITFDPQGG